MNIRIGHGYDVHRFAEDRKLIIGGVEIEYEYGLLGHSDADVLIHAIMDSVLGALALGLQCLAVRFGDHFHAAALDDSGNLQKFVQTDGRGNNALHRLARFNRFSAHKYSSIFKNRAASEEAAPLC